MANRTVSVNLVANIGQYVSGMNAAAGATLRLGESATASTKKARSGFDLASKGAVLMGAAVVGGMALAVSKSLEFEKAMSAAAAATQATGSALGDLRDAAMKAGADTQYSATEAAQAITEMGKAGVSTADILGGGLNGALALAAAGQLDVAEAAEIASVAMTQFKLEGDKLPHVADLLAAGAGKAMGSVGDLGMALNQAGMVASSTGLSIEETTGTLAAFASAGLIGSDAGTSFRSMLQHLQNPSKESAEAMADLGINMYDAQGQFVGMEGLAGQLQTSMANLTPAVRDAAMAQIFGSDAVRAANVLYSEGADGIADWTAKVNDQGYAAEQAAKLNDNLAGDLEKLGGAFDTLMISVGSGAQGPLRWLVQGFTNLLDGIADLGGPLKSLGGFLADNKEVAIALASALAVQLVGGVGAVKLAFDRLLVGAALSGFTTSLITGFQGVASFLTGGFSAAIGTARTALVGLLTTAAPLAAVAAVAYGVVKVVEFATAAGDARDEVRDMWDAVDDSRGSAQLEALAGVIDQIESKIRSLRDELPETTGAFQGLLSPTGMLDNGSAVQSLDVFSAALVRAKERQEEAYDTARILGNQFDLNRDQVLALADKYNIDLTVGTQNAYLQFQRFYTTEYGKGPNDSTQQLITSLSTMASVTSTAEERVDALKTALDILGGKQVSVFEATSALQQVVQSATGALEGLTGEVLTADGHLNAYSESGQKAGDILIGVRDKGNDLITTMVEQGATIEEVRAADAQLRQSFIDSAMQMGISEEAANALATEILGVPEERETRFTAATDQAAAKISALQAQIDAVSKDRTATINFRSTMPDLNGSASGTGRMGTFAEGGYTGPGSKYQPAGIVHAGEYVLTKDQTSRLGIEQIEAFANRGYAGGGLVTLAGAANMSAASGGLTVLDSAVSGAIARTLDAIASMAPAAGGGSLGGAWGAIWQYVKTRIPQARQNSTFRAGDPGYHGKGKAIDFGFGSGPGGAGSAGLASINRLLHDGVGSSLAELIYDGIGDDRPDLYHGKPHTYNAGTRAEHRNHVHAAVYDQGGWLQPGYTMAYNGTGAPERVLTSRDFSGGGGGGGGGGSTVNLVGAKISGTVAFDPSGMLRFVDAQITEAFTSVTDRQRYNGR